MFCQNSLPWPYMSWVALPSMAHSLIELDKAVVHVIKLVSFLWLWFSVYLPSDGEGKRLMEASWGERLTGGKWILFWWAMLSKSLIQFPAEGWGCVPSLLFDLRPNSCEGNENNNHRELIELITWTMALSNSMKLCRPTQDGWIIEDSFDKTWSTGQRNDKPLQYSCLENPMNSTKRQKYMILKDEFSRSLCA